MPSEIDDRFNERIRQAVDEGFEEQVAFTAELVREPSLMGNEAGAQNLMERGMTELGLEVDRWRLDAVRLEGMRGFSPPEVSYERSFNVVGSHRPVRHDGRSLILNGHVDVVPLGLEERWQYPPFGAVIEEGWMFGRGAGDMKAGTAAGLFALKALDRAGVSPTAPIHLQSVVEEESTGNGTLACLERGYHADLALIPEPTSTTWTKAQVGLMWFEVMVEGSPRHPALAGGDRSNAIENAFLLCKALRDLEAQWNEERSNHPLFADLEHPIVINVGKIEGGDWTSSVPSWCRFEIRVGIYPGWKREWVPSEIERCLLEAAAHDPFLARFPPRVRPKGQYGEGYVVENADQAVRFWLAITGRSSTGISWAASAPVPPMPASSASTEAFPPSSMVR